MLGGVLTQSIIVCLFARVPCALNLNVVPHILASKSGLFLSEQLEIFLKSYLNFTLCILAAEFGLANLSNLNLYYLKTFLIIDL